MSTGGSHSNHAKTAQVVATQIRLKQLCCDNWPPTNLGHRRTAAVF